MVIHGALWDPPYGVHSKQQVEGLDPKDEQKLQETFELMVGVLHTFGVLLIFSSESCSTDWVKIAASLGLCLVNRLVWQKPTSPGRNLRTGLWHIPKVTEHIYVFSKRPRDFLFDGKWVIDNKIQDVMSYPAVQARDRFQLVQAGQAPWKHPFEKPVPLCLQLMRIFGVDIQCQLKDSKVPITWIDPTCGSGATAEAAAHLGIRFFGNDHLPQNIDLCFQRGIKLTDRWKETGYLEAPVLPVFSHPSNPEYELPPLTAGETFQQIYITEYRKENVKILENMDDEPEAPREDLSSLKDFETQMVLFWSGSSGCGLYCRQPLKKSQGFLCYLCSLILLTPNMNFHL